MSYINIKARRGYRALMPNNKGGHLEPWSGYNVVIILFQEYT